MPPSPITQHAILPPPAPTPPELLGCYRNVKDLAGADLLTFASLTAPVVLGLFETARELKRGFREARPGHGQGDIAIPRGRRHGHGDDALPHSSALANVTAVLLFEKPSLRTKMSFETGIGLLGGRSIFMDHSAQKLGEREAVKDYAKNLERWVDCIIARVYSQEILYELAEHARVPVINALSDRFHPCQALADLFTVAEQAGRLGVPLGEMKIVYVGDGNNVCHSLMHAACMLGVGMTVVTPKGYGPADDVIAECESMARASGSKLTFSTSLAAAEGHHAVYTDVWVSMGQADQAAKRRKVFVPYQVNSTLLALASKGLDLPEGAMFMHCLPAQRGVEVTDEVIDSPASLVYEQAENRMHAQDALLLHMFKRS